MPTLLAARDDGGCFAGLVFRVGGADEHLAVRGVTHLVEHLALRAAGLPATHARDGLSDLVTRFSVTGTPDEVAAALTAVCTGLRTPPTRLLDEERLAMRAEELARDDAATRAAALMRWGARGRGLASYPDVGLAVLDAEDRRDLGAGRLHPWERRAVGQRRGRPRGLDLDPARGRAAAAARAPHRSCRAPRRGSRWRHGACRSPGSSPRCAATDVYAHLLDRALREDLDGLVTSVRAHASAARRPRPAMVDGRRARPAQGPRGARGRRRRRAGAGALGAARRGRPRGRRRGAPRGGPARPRARGPRRGGRRPAARAHRPPARGAPGGAARGQCGGRPRRRRDPSTAAPSPRCRSADSTGPASRATPSGSSAVVDGREHPVRGGGRAVLVVGTDGVSLRSAAGVVTVRYRELAAMEAFADGGRWLVGEDGFRVHVEPDRATRSTPRTSARIDEAVDAARIVHLAARPDDRLPRPADPRTSAAPRRRLPRLPRGLGRTDRG